MTTQPSASQPEKTSRSRWRLTRRGFLIGAGLAGTGLAVGVVLGLPRLRTMTFDLLESGAAEYGTAPNVEPWAWFEVMPDSRIQLYVTKVEMGQGIHTALAQVAVEELGVAWSDLAVVQATTSQGPLDSLGTLGSISVRTMYEPLREAGAVFREILLGQAAVVLQQDPAELQIQNRYVVAGASGRQVALWDLATARTDWQEPDTPVVLKSPTEFTTIGQSVPRVDVPDKVTGKGVYGYDAQLPGMQYGAILRAPTFEGRIRRVNLQPVQDQTDVHILHQGQFVGAVAPTRTRARQALQQLDVDWDTGRPWNQTALEAMVTVGQNPNEAVTIQAVGNTQEHLSQPQHTATYRTPFAAHSPMEPQAALADVQPDSVRVWVSTQQPARTRRVVARALERDVETVEIIPTLLGGGFGRKYGDDVAVEAARLAQMAGVPVHVGWDRTEELRSGFLRPPTHHRLFAQTEQGRIQAMEHHQASGDVLFSFLPGVAGTLLGADMGATRGARITYAVPHRRTLAWRRKLPIPTGSWRGLGLLANGFALESFMDEIAYAEGQDPLQFRLDHLPDSEEGQRLRNVLLAVADQANWGDNLSPDHAQGLACCLDGGTAVAQIAEVGLTAGDKSALAVHRVTAVMDCGLVINPDGAQAQLEGNIMWGVSSTLLESVRIAEGRIVAGNFDLYPVLSLAQAPEIQASVQSSGDQPFGTGEPGIGPVAAAIANAWFQLTGERVRRLPFARSESMGA